MFKRMQFFSMLLLLLAVSFSCQTSKQTSPNVIIILTDDQGYKDVGFNGSTYINTPNIDRIASNGVVFTDGYVSYAVCGPSRAGLITGRYQDRFGFSRNPLFAPKDSLQGLPLSEQTLSEVLNEEGYATMAIGKWHLGAHESLRPMNRGFDHFFGFLTGGHRYLPEELTMNNLSELNSQFDAYKTKLLSDNERVEETEYLTDAFSREAVKFIEKNEKNPFFLYLAYNAPHKPFQATKKYLDRYQHIKNKNKRTYAAMISAVDDGVGDILSTLEELEIIENTIIVFLSDNGGIRKSVADNGNLRAGKGSLYEGGIRVPFAMQWNRKIPKGVVYQKPVISLDIFSTVIAQVGVTTKKPLDGINLIPYLRGEKEEDPHKELFWRKYDQKSYAVRSGDLKLVRMNGKEELYDLKTDIGEKLVLEKEEKIALRKSHRLWEQKNSAPVFYGLMQNEQYNKENPDRFKNVKKY